MKILLLVPLAAWLAGCSSPPLPEFPNDASSVDAPTTTTPYQPVMAGTEPHAPVGLKPWRQLNDEVAPNAGRTP